ncbi:MAG: hypothetical protein L0H36_03640 [bacterium]|nr:hypothetical protein [bacterium]MDN5835702.1 hypothetical protein [bacterium]
MIPDEKPSVTDDQRLRAATRTLTIDPLAGNIKPDEDNEAEQVAHHLANGPLPNTPEESEDSESASIQSRPQSIEKKRSRMALYSGVVATCLVVAIIVYGIYY